MRLFTLERERINRAFTIKLSSIFGKLSKSFFSNSLIKRFIGAPPHNNISSSSLFDSNEFQLQNYNRISIVWLTQYFIFITAYYYLDIKILFRKSSIFYFGCISSFQI
ncbi:hypothetical protein EWW47_15810 [Bacillus thuringiensis]|nr:hypothetical protein DOS87_17055 [Bacillus sp. CR71]AXR23420.1 hypothetical protein DPQ26_17060 [Bacillus sp. E25]KAA8488555.1 hypothetical protein FYW98_08405 [Bacillus thuringiensis]KAB2394285.1 hypothetical protein F8171_17815 [Bacillus cereus]KAB2416314.1 hypothetical protein F8169_11285 [Bacillus cereus]